MKVLIKKLSEEEIKALSIKSWPIWTKQKSKFDWFYDSQEQCLFLEGRVIVHTDNDKYEINKGDFAIFPKGLKCVWEVLEPVKKHYNFD